jgi:hypothetical protein
VGALEALMRELLSSRPQDAAFARLRRALAVYLPGETFRAVHLQAHATQFPELKAALAECCLQGASEIGCWLRDHAGLRDGIRIARKGKLWKVTLESDVTDIT